MKINRIALMKLFRSYITTPLLLSRNRCPTPEVILRYLRAKASRRERKKITSHISRCSSCAKEVDFILRTFREENKLFRRLGAVMETAKPNAFFPRPAWKYATVLIPAILLISFAITFLFKTSERSQLRGKSNNYIKLEQTINNTVCDVVVSGTPIDLTRILKINKPMVRIRYNVGEKTAKELEDIVDKFLKTHNLL